MAKYNDWTRGEDEALLNVVGGVDVARAVLRGERKLVVEAAPKLQAPTRPPLVGKVWKTIVVPAYQAGNFAETVRLGNFDNADSLGDTIRQFGKEQVGLNKPVEIDLIEFDRDWWQDEALAWGTANGNKQPIAIAQLMGIAAGFPNEQRERPIVELGSMQDGDVLCLFGGSGWRDLCRDTVESGWYRDYLVGFVSE